jgi:hypothetical protein
MKKLILAVAVLLGMTACTDKSQQMVKLAEMSLRQSVGEGSEVKVVRSVHELLDNEAVRVCKSLPKFFPGSHGGRAVAMWLTLPITFKLEDKSQLESTED